jgi:hypothetical protein
MLRRSVAVLAVLALAGCARPAGELTQPAPTVAMTATSSAMPSAAPAVLVEPSYRIMPMPISPTWEPEQPVRYLHYDPRWTEYMGWGTLGEWRLEYPTAKLTLRVSGSDPTGLEFFAGDLASPPAPVSMLGVEAEMITAPYGHEQFWVWYLTDPDGLSFVVSGTDPEVVERFATGLRREPRAVPPSFQVALLPEQFVPMRVDEHAMEFSPPAGCCERGYVAIFLVVPDPTDNRTGTPATVNGNPAEVFVRDADIAVHIGLPDGSELQVSAASQVGLDEAQILRIAEGVTVTPAAVPFRSL